VKRETMWEREKLVGFSPGEAFEPVRLQLVKHKQEHKILMWENFLQGGVLPSGKSRHFGDRYEENSDRLRKRFEKIKTKPKTPGDYQIKKEEEVEEEEVHVNPEDLIPDMFREENMRSGGRDGTEGHGAKFYKTLAKLAPEARQVLACLRSGHNGPMWDVGDNKWASTKPKDILDKDTDLRALVKTMALAEHPITGGVHKAHKGIHVRAWKGWGDKQIFVPHERKLPENPKPSKLEVKEFMQLETVAGRARALNDLKTDAAGRGQAKKEFAKKKRAQKKAKEKRERDKKQRDLNESRVTTADMKLKLNSSFTVPDGFD
jgi:hypothetical protein